MLDRYLTDNSLAVNRHISADISAVSRSIYRSTIGRCIGRLSADMSTEEPIVHMIRVYLYEDHINTAKSKNNPTSAACFLLSCFYKNSELVGKNLTGANAREGLNADIVSSILGKYIAFGVFVILLLLGICTLVHVDQHDFLRDQPCKKTLGPSI